MRIPRVVIAGTQSGAGKTTVTAGLIGALTRRGVTVQPFKIGPDYIDPTYHTEASGRHCRNLDSWMLSRKRMTELFVKSASDAGIAIIEGVMGLFDGMTGNRETASTAEVAKILKAPVILILDVWGMTRSAGAIALGYKEFDRRLQVAGVILNRISSDIHAKSCTSAIENIAKLPVIGTIPSKQEIAIQERHLGLVPTTERKELKHTISKVTDLVETHVNLHKLQSLAKSASPLYIRSTRIRRRTDKGTVTIGVAFDEAFSFYYRDALETLEGEGASIRYFSPLHDGQLPSEVSGLYIGGGFPEVLAKDLAANESMRAGIRKAAEEGIPIFTECGGLMYLTRSIRDFEGNEHPMTAVLDGGTVMDRRLTLSYTLAKTIRDNILCSAGDRIRGHEYHYSRIVDIPSDARFGYEMEKGVGINGKYDGWLEYATLALYSHTHIGGKPKLARNLLAAARQYAKK